MSEERSPARSVESRAPDRTESPEGSSAVAGGGARGTDGGVMEPGTQVRDSEGHIGVVIRPEDSCWQRTRYRTSKTVCADPLDGHVLVRLDQERHTLRDYWYRPDDLEVQS